MNRKQKLIISITGITIVMLALLGITYAYYLTRIQGNTNSNSISITTADLTLKYDDGSSYINLTNIMPGMITDGEGDNPEPKVFTVTNDGSGDVEYSIGIDEVTNTLTRTQDLTYSITCVEKLIDSAGTSYTACTTTPSNSGEYPKTNSYLFTNQIKQDYIQKYTVIISYANPDEDQSIDMGSTIKGRMQIYSLPESIDITGTVTGATTGDYVQINSNPKTSVIASDGTYKLIGIEPGTHTLKVMNGSTTKGTKEIVVKQGTSSGISGNTITFTATERVATVNITSVQTNLGVNITEIKDEKPLLKDVIIENAKKNMSGYTMYSETPLSEPGRAASNGEEMTLSKTQDDYGDSYYFRGNINDNYLSFNNMCWRIMRIQGDGSIKIILAADNTECNENINDSTYSDSSFAFDANYGYIEDDEGNYIADYENSTTGIKALLQNWYDEKLFSKQSFLKKENWCITNTDYIYNSSGTLLPIANKPSLISEQTKFYYNDARRIEGLGMEILPQLMCDETSNQINSYIGTLTIDEAIYAGYYSYDYTNSYLNDNAQAAYFSLSLCNYGCAISPASSSACLEYGTDKVYLLSISGVNYGNWNNVQNENPVRPVVVLNNSIKYKEGNGTITNPYIIE